MGVPVQNLGDVRRFNAHMREKLLRRVTGLPADLREWQPAAGRWSAREHLEHIALAEKEFLAILRDLVAEGREKGLVAPPDAPRAVDATRPLAAAPPGPRKSPPDYWPTGRSLAEVEGVLAENGAEAERVAEALYGLDTDRLTRHMPVLGVTLNAAQLLHLIGCHAWLHLQHVEANVKAWEARAGTPPAG